MINPKEMRVGDMFKVFGRFSKSDVFLIVKEMLHYGLKVELVDINKEKTKYFIIPGHGGIYKFELENTNYFPYSWQECHFVGHMPALLSRGLIIINQ
jgi:hypothetical protein